MTTIAVTVSDELRQQLESVASAEGLSLEAWLTDHLSQVARAGAPSAAESDSDVARLRRKLAEAGLLMTFKGPAPRRPSEARLAAARAAAGKGTLLSDIVSEDRG